MATLQRLSLLRINCSRSFSSVRRVSPARKITPSSQAAAPQTAASPLPPLKATEQEPVSAPRGNAFGSSELSLVSSKFPLKDAASVEYLGAHGIDWSDSFHGLGQQAFSKEAVDTLLAPLASEDIEIKPDGLLYLPEIKYRRILNRAFGPGGWGLAPRTETLVTPKQVSREYALVCNGRLVSVARGEQDYFGGEEKLTTALEGCKSNALMRCCKDLGIASELWDPVFIRKFKKSHCDEMFAEHVVTKKKKKLWKLKVNSFEYPYKAS